MKNSMFTKTAAVAAGFAMALSAAAPAGAVTVAELQAQIAALMAQLSSLQGGATTSTTVTFTRDLTVGSSGADVTALQQTLVAQGYLTMPAGTAFGYFGTLTKSAVARWQAAVGLPATGYFGALSRAKIGASATGTTTGGTTTGGTTTGGTTGGVSGTITTPGAEGTLTITAAPVSNTTLYEGESMDPIVAFNAKATGSDIALQRVRVNLGTNTNLYNKVFQTLYVRDDAGRTLASVDMNSTNVVKDTDGTYYVTLSGFSSVVPKGTQRTYNVAATIRSSVDSTYRTSYTNVNIPADGIRGVDGAGIDLYGPASALTSTFTIASSLASSATLTVSTDSSNPLTQQVVANGGSNNNQLDKLVVLVFDVKADKDDVKLTDVNDVAIASTGAATASTTYLYVGNGTNGQLLGSAAATGSTTDFNNLSYMIPKGTTATFTVAADVRNAGTSASTLTASVLGQNVLGQNSIGDTVTGTGSASGNTFTVTSSGVVFTLVGTPTIAKSSIVSGQQSTSTATATFNLQVKAVGADVLLGDTGSSTGALVSVDPNGSFQVYRDGAAVSLAGVASSTVATFDSSFQSLGSNTYKLAQNNTGTVQVTFTFKGADTTNAPITFGNYAVGLKKLTYVGSSGVSTQTFMNGLTAWRTPTVVMP